MGLLRKLFRLRPGLPRLALPSGTRASLANFLHRAVPFAFVAFAVVAVAAFVALAVSYAAERAYGGGRDDRASAEATSFAAHSSWLATGDAFGGYIQLLRDAEDPAVRDIAVPSDARSAALRRLLELNTNRFSSLAVVDLNGTLIAASDASLLDAVSSQAYTTVRANRGNANSDIVLPPGAPAYVDYATILVDPLAGPWAVLVARADPSRLWQSTLAATVDGGRNVIINRDGQLAAGTSPELLGSTWSASEFAGDAYRSTVVGVDSVCSLAPIAKDTQIDHDWNVAACLPASTVLASGSAPNQVALFAGVAAVCAALLGLGALALVARERGPAEASEPIAAVEATEVDETPVEEEVAPVAQILVLPQEVADARTLIEAYEDRSARVAGRIRDSVQARLLVASSRVEEALELIEADVALARVMLLRAAHELDDLNEHELRSMGQELYPDLVRLGLPAALRALRKDLTDLVKVDVTADAGADSLDETNGRAIEMPRRIAMYRLALDALRQFSEAGLEDCTIDLQRSDTRLWLAMKGHGEGGALDVGPLAAARIAVQAYGGRFVLDRAHDTTEVAVEYEFAASASEPPAVEPDPEDPKDENAEADAEPEAA